MRAGELEREVPKESFSGDVSNWAEDDHGAREAGVAETDSLVGGELRHRLAPDQVLPVVLKRKLVTAAGREILFVRDPEIGGFLAQISAVEI